MKTRRIEQTGNKTKVAEACESREGLIFYNDSPDACYLFLDGSEYWSICLHPQCYLELPRGFTVMAVEAEWERANPGWLRVTESGVSL